MSNESLSELNQALRTERSARQLISRIHSSLDKDMVLQCTIDMLGHMLKATSCLMVSWNQPAPPLVTHEYLNPLNSPLGLGGSSQISDALAGLFFEKTYFIADTSVNGTPQHAAQIKELCTNGIGAVLGCPISTIDSDYGLLLVQDSEPRAWQNEEVLLVETAANELARALSHVHAYQELKEQVFNLQLLASISQQLNSSLEQMNRSVPAEKVIETVNNNIGQLPLSTRELEVLRLIASGLANREIAQKLFLTESTVELHASRIRKKLKLKSRTALVKFACDNKLV